MRLLDSAGNPIAGGNGETGFHGLQLGDKEQRGGGANTRYYLQVERSGLVAPGTLAYRLACESGSGHTPGDLIRYQEPVDRF